MAKELALLDVAKEARMFGTNLLGVLVIGVAATGTVGMMWLMTKLPLPGKKREVKDPLSDMIDDFRRDLEAVREMGTGIEDFLPTPPEEAPPETGPPPPRLPPPPFPLVLSELTSLDPLINWVGAAVNWRGSVAIQGKIDPAGLGIQERWNAGNWIARGLYTLRFFLPGETIGPEWMVLQTFNSDDPNRSAGPLSDRLTRLFQFWIGQFTNPPEFFVGFPALNVQFSGLQAWLDSQNPMNQPPPEATPGDGGGDLGGIGAGDTGGGFGGGGGISTAGIRASRSFSTRALSFNSRPHHTPALVPLTPFDPEDEMPPGTWSPINRPPSKGSVRVSRAFRVK